MKLFSLIVLGPGCLWLGGDALDERVLADLDGDGVRVDEDCNDLDVEVLGPTTWYGDADGDGWGDFTKTETACVHGEGFVESGGDCDDTMAAVHPDAVEIWYDGVDSDCDAWDDYDADGDGERSSAWGGLDCDDADASVNPTQEEVCADGLDNDCDGGAGDCGWAGEVDVVQVPAILGEDEGGRLGVDLLALADLDSDGDDDFAVSVYRGLTGPGVDAGWVGLVRDPVSADVGLADVATTRFLGVEADDRTGRSMVVGGYLTGTGKIDFVIGAERVSLGGTRGGAVYLTTLNVTGDVDLAGAITI